MIETISKIPDIVDKFAIYCTVVGLEPRPWQWYYISEFFRLREVAWNWCRGSGKTFIMSHLYVFMRIAALVTDSFWIAASWSQLNRAQLYWKTNKTVEKFKPSKSRDRITLMDGYPLLFTGATDENVNGPRGEAVFYDEVARFDKLDFWNSFPIADHVDDPYRLFSSTPLLHTPFHTVCQKYPVFTQTYLDCPEMNHAAIEARKEFMPLWLWKLNYMCIFSLPDGIVFPFITESTDPVPYGLRVKQGVDFGITPGHSLVRIHIDEPHKKVYIVAEELYKYKTEHDKLKEQCHKYPTEVESGGFNEAFAPYFKGVNITQVPFTNESKFVAIQWLLERELIINPRTCPQTLKDMQAAMWEISDKGKPKVETGNLHNLAALMHAGGDGQAVVDTGRPQRPQRKRLRLK